jgi:hypothetical protein
LLRSSGFVWNKWQLTTSEAIDTLIASPFSTSVDIAALSAAVADGRRARLSSDADTRLITASLDGRSQSQGRAMGLLDRNVAQLHQGSIEGKWAKVMKAAKDICPAAEQRRSLARDMCALEAEIGGLREAVAANGAKLKADLVSIERQAKDSQRKSQGRDARAMVDMRAVVRRLGAQLQAVVEENGRQVSAGAETRRANEQLRGEVGG